MLPARHASPVGMLSGLRGGKCKWITQINFYLSETALTKTKFQFVTLPKRLLKMRAGQSQCWQKFRQFVSRPTKRAAIECVGDLPVRKFMFLKRILVMNRESNRRTLFF